MRLFLSVILSCLLMSGNLTAQCECDGDRKYHKLLSQSKDKGRELRERIDILEEAIESYEDCMQPRLMLALVYFKRAERSSKISYSTAQLHFEEISRRCPDFHADIPYHLGVIYFGQEKWSMAKEQFDLFLDFSRDDQSKIASDDRTRVENVDEIMDELEFNVDLFENPVPFEPVRLEGVSSSKDEYLPMISPDNEQIFYTRRYQRKAKGDLYGTEVEEYTLSSREEISESFDKGKALTRPFNLGDNYGGSSISVNNKEMFVTVCKPTNQGYNNCDIYVTKFSKVFNERTREQEYKWSELHNLGSSVNTHDGWEAQPSLSADGNTLYFATARASSIENGNGGKSIDIYFSRRGVNGQWTQARSIGSEINSPANEKSPFMHGDSHTLYFSSDGFNGVGGYDIFYSRLKDDGTWSSPRNIGIPINTPEDEHGLIVSTDGDHAYFASNKLKDAQGYDIYRFDVPQSARPEQVVLVKGFIKDDDGDAITDARIQLNYVDSKRVEEVIVDEDDGAYATIINVEREPVVMTIDKEEHVFQAKLFSVDKSDLTMVEMEVQMEKMEMDKPYTMRDINYGTNSATIGEESKSVLQLFAVYLLKHPGIKISIHGHTDNVGSETDNLALSTDRAFEVMSYLQSQGVPAERIDFKGFGASRPIADNYTEEGRSMNRRTEFIITAR